MINEENGLHVGGSKEIDLMGMLKKVYQRKRLLMKFVLVSGLFGVFMAFNHPRAYTSQVVLAPENESGMSLSSGFSNIANMMGVNIGSMTGSDAIYPEIYPDLFVSSDFIVTLFDVPVHLKKDPTDRTYINHLLHDTFKPIWDTPVTAVRETIKKITEKDEQKKAINDIDPFFLTREQDAMCTVIRGNIGCVVDKKNSLITITATDEDPMVAAILADTLQRRLQQYVTAYRTQKARHDLQYVQQLHDEAKAHTQEVQTAYARYADTHQNVLLKSYGVKQSDLENDLQMAYQIQNQVAAQLEVAKSKVQERTPVFAVIQGATVPHRPSSTPKIMIAAAWVLLGVFLAVVWVLWGEPLWKNRKRKAAEQPEATSGILSGVLKKTEQ